MGKTGHRLVISVEASPPFPEVLRRSTYHHVFQKQGELPPSSASICKIIPIVHTVAISELAEVVKKTFPWKYIYPAPAAFLRQSMPNDGLQAL
jgi:hypothetical protein